MKSVWGLVTYKMYLPKIELFNTPLSFWENLEEEIELFAYIEKYWKKATLNHMHVEINWWSRKINFNVLQMFLFSRLLPCNSFMEGERKYLNKFCCNLIKILFGLSFHFQNNIWKIKPKILWYRILSSLSWTWFTTVSFLSMVPFIVSP